jgi:protein-S-isoprenylcysteine O-methyltransferase Ste14
VTRLPSLGPRGEGWVILQFVLLGLIGAAGLWLGQGWDGGLRNASVALGVAIVVAGGSLAALGGRDLGSALTPLPHPRESAQLVDAGVYHRVRHPIYGGVILGALGWSLLTASTAALALSVVLWLFFVLKSTREEAWLMRRFAGYAEYRTRTRRFIPWIG